MEGSSAPNQTGREKVKPSFLTPAQREKVLRGFNNTQAAYPSERLIHELFEAQVVRAPEAVAIIAAGQSVTYGELNRRANRVANALWRRGVQPDDRVAIYAERGAELIVGLLGILKAGGAYVPLDVAYPAERIAYMVADSEPVVVLSQERLKAKLPVT